MAGTDIHLHHLTSHIGLEHFNILKSALYIEKSVFDQVIIFNKSGII